LQSALKHQAVAVCEHCGSYRFNIKFYARWYEPSCIDCGKAWSPPDWRVETFNGKDQALAQGRDEPQDVVPAAEGKVKFDRNAYQRELMRKRRAEGKAK
jgi:hypothetical protein